MERTRVHEVHREKCKQMGQHLAFTVVCVCVCAIVHCGLASAKVSRIAYIVITEHVVARLTSEHVVIDVE